MPLRTPLPLAAALLLHACSSSPITTSTDGGSDLATVADLAASDLAGDAASASACPNAAGTTATSTVTGGCALLQRDTSPCLADRTSQGLSGAWLKFSCRAQLTAQASYVQVVSDGEPDYESNFFPTSNACYAAFSPAFPDPNTIMVQNVTVKAPRSPTTTGQKMGLGVVGVAINGVAIFDNQAAPGDDIYKEVGSFDRCQGHPAPGGEYHYHSEPYAISYDDANLIGVLADGYFVYGRRDSDGSQPTLDANGGHVGTTADSASAVYHYHLSEQTSTATGTAGQMAWFLTTGSYEGTTLP